MRLVGLEEHILTPAVLGGWLDLDPSQQDLALGPATAGEFSRRLLETGPDRLATMDATGLDAAVLSLHTPGLQNFAAADAVALQTDANDVLAEAVRAHPDRFGGFATLALGAPQQAADELRRAVGELGLDGAMIYSQARDRPLDDPAVWPVLEAAAALRAPLYLHPASPPGTVRSAYYAGFDEAVDLALATHRLGWHYDTGVALLRLILRGAFDRFPDLQVIVGHWGELVLFYLDRLAPLASIAGLPRPLVDYFRTQIFVTPSGMLSHRYLRWAGEVIGLDRVLFSTDYPFEPAAHQGAREFLEAAELSEPERGLIADGTWETLRARILR